MVQKEKEKKIYEDYQRMIFNGIRSTEAVRAIMKKYSYGYEASIFALIRRVRQRIEKGE